MKIRQGFISNSSSSSFVVLGARLENKPESVSDEDWDKMCEDLNSISVLYTESPSKYIVGKVLADISSDGGGYLEDMEVSLDDLQKDAKKVKKEVKKILGIDIEPKLISGTRPN